MSIRCHVWPGEHGRTIYRDTSGQELLGPATARITVEDELELSPYPKTFVDVELHDGRYAATAVGVETSSEDPVTVRGLQQIRLPEILRRGLRHDVTIRRTSEAGETSTGVGAEDRLPLTYLLAFSVGANPLEAVQQKLGLKTRQAAAQRVARARRAVPPRLPPAEKQGAR